MSIKNLFGWLLVALSVGMAVQSIWDSIFTYNQMGYFAILLGMSMFTIGAVLTRRSQPRETAAAAAAAATPALRETRASKALPASQSSSVSDWTQERVAAEENQAESVRNQKAQESLKERNRVFTCFDLRLP